ncbi:MAG: 50S ribosomal protein L3 [Francisellaceae bacterium]|jgi:large subunit ribosomal protein L3|nr:50S ribosomal protein L3 [Francisellaceae bacterium]MBT6539129.1 50S ribosomal protein L3 [Francisellaceae bacterium]
MPMGLIGKKCGMSRVFTEAGRSIPVTVIEVSENYLTQCKTSENDGYTAVQVTTGSKKASRVKSPEKGHFAKAKVEAGRCVHEFRMTNEEMKDYKIGDSVSVNFFKEGQYLDVVGTTIGKGFAGVIKRHNFSSQRMTHGNSLAHRAPGSIGQCQTPGRVFKGKKMAGHMGDVRRTAQGLEVIKIDESKKVILVKGAVPGAKGSDLLLKLSIKQRANVNAA